MKKHSEGRQREIAAIAAKSDAEIDVSEMPEVLDWSGAEVGKFYRPAKKPVTLRLDGDVIEWLKSFGPGYQTRANGLLRHAMESSSASNRPQEETDRMSQLNVSRPRRLRSHNYSRHLRLQNLHFKIGMWAPGLRE